MLLPMDAAVMAHLTARRPFAVRYLVWVEPRDWDSAATVGVGFWTGEGTRDIDVVDPETDTVTTRLFYGTGPAVGFEGLEDAAGMDVHPLSITLSAIDAAVALAVRGYDLRAAPIEVYRGYKDPEQRGFLAPPRAIFEGKVNSAPIPTPPPGGTAELTLDCVPLTRLLTIGNPARLSDAQLRRRSGDRLLRYADTAQMVTLAWGQKSNRVTGKKGSIA